MNRQEKLEAEAARAKIATTWTPRMDILENRGLNPMKQGIFCEKYDVPKAVFSRAKTGKTIPSQDTVDKVEAGFDEQGV